MVIDERIEALKARGREFKNARELSAAIKIDYAFRQEITEVYQLLFKRKLTGCSNCIADAYVEITHLSKQKIMEKQALTFRLRRGVLLHDTVNFDASKMMSAKNTTNELALYHLATNPACEIYFEELPGDWVQQREAYKQQMVAAQTAGANMAAWQDAQPVARPKQSKRKVKKPKEIL